MAHGTPVRDRRRSIGQTGGVPIELNHTIVPARDGETSAHWFATLFSMVAAWAALASVEKPQRWQWRPLIAGLAAGAAAMVTPTRGALAMLAGATSFVDSRRQRIKLIVYVLGSALIPICLLMYVIAQGAFAAAFDDMAKRAAGQKHEGGTSLYPNVADGVDGMNFITQCVASSKEDAAWRSLKHPLCRV